MEQTVTRFIDLASDILLAIYLNLDVEDVLSLKQSCRVLHTIGSLDYLWHKLIRTCDLPLDVPLGVDSLTLSGQELQAIVVNALKLDHKWRKPDACIQRAIPIIRSNTSYVDHIYLLPGGRWLVTVTLVGRRTDLTLWYLDNATSPRSIKTVPIHGRVRSCRAYYQPALHKFTIAAAQGTQSIEVYHMLLENLAVVSIESESLVFHCADELSSLGQIDELRIFEDTLGATFLKFAQDTSAVHIYLRNLVTGAAATLGPYQEGDEKPYLFELFRNQYALADFSEQTVSFYDIPPPIISPTLDSESPANSEPNSNHLSEGLLSTRCRLLHNESAYYMISSGSIEHDIPILNIMLLDWPQHNGILERFSPPNHQTRFSGCPTIASQVVSNRGRRLDEVQLGATGRRAVWVDIGDATTLKKWTASRYCRGEELSAGTTVLVPPASGLPFSLEVIRRIAFDEVTCRLCVSLHTGELYLCEFL
ncbi:hypothetical protein BJ138DRAFT_1119722 [Hygrophoropsis aurantiaca]|uniref:Uncharacterized protein n=1 Tax=Hygrophoropsis aurantiaca TaxID=72124 RepID=A0ACB7ZTC0_9AGAM|nr:hypothetical protein BJ138DRAFT_1119722 [Hygrophoropsis aurantiaca]